MPFPSVIWLSESTVPFLVSALSWGVHLSTFTLSLSPRSLNLCDAKSSTGCCQETVAHCELIVKESQAAMGSLTIRLAMPAPLYGLCSLKP